MNQKDRTEMEKKTFHAAETFNDRTEQLKEYLRRLGAGEALESVRADFVKQFSDVEASEIMQAEQKLLKEGTPLTEVQKLCDVHSALFHGATKEERIANAEKEVEASRKRIANAEDGADASLKREKLQEELAKRVKFEKKGIFGQAYKSGGADCNCRTSSLHVYERKRSAGRAFKAV